MTRNDRRGGFTLIELIGVLAVIAILAGMLLPNVIKMTQTAEADSEEKSLESFAKGLEAFIVRTRTIPQNVVSGAIPAWDTAIAGEMGVSPGAVSTNRLRNPRYYIWDNAATSNPSLNAAAYTQTAVNAVAASLAAGESRPRVMIVSSVGPALVGIASGATATAAFDLLWNWDGASAILNLPAADAVTFLRVQRINLSTLFFDVSVRSQPITQFGTVYIPAATAIGGVFNMLTVPANVSLTRVSSQCPNALSNVGVTTYTVNHPTLGVLIPATNTGTAAVSAAVPTAVTAAAGILTTTIGGAATVFGNSIGVEIDYQATPNYQLATGAITPVPPGAAITMSVIKDTPLSLYSNDGATILQTIYVAFNDSFWYTPGPPEAWGR